MNEVIIFGGDHYNTLALARVFGINGLKPYGILTVTEEQKKRAYAYKSKYWRKYWLVNDEHEGLMKIMEVFETKKEKAVIFPSSDGAEAIIDNNLNILKPRFFVPGINGKQGCVSRLMNKANQSSWLRSIGLKMAETWELSLDKFETEVYKIKKYPCILKPVCSIEGKKTDIVKCSTDKMAKEYMVILKQKGYSRILAQEFLAMDYEISSFGCITRNSSITPYLLVEKVRSWPPETGSGTCCKFIENKKYKLEVETFLKKLQDYGYTGNFDIDFFVVGGELYVNEINFRNSGLAYACFYNKVFYSYIWYQDVIGLDISNMNIEYSGRKYAMNELTDFIHVLCGNIKFGEWLSYFKDCGDFAIKFEGDMAPAYKKYMDCILQVLKRIKVVVFHYII